MAVSALRRRKKASQDARWRALTPAQRLSRASAMVAGGRALRAAGLARLGFTAAEIRRIERTRDR